MIPKMPFDLKKHLEIMNILITYLDCILGHIHTSEHIKLYTLSMCSLLYVDDKFVFIRMYLIRV